MRIRYRGHDAVRLSSAHNTDIEYTVLIHTQGLKRVQVLLGGHAGVYEGVHAGHGRLSQRLGHVQVAACDGVR